MVHQKTFCPKCGEMVTGSKDNHMKRHITTKLQTFIIIQTVITGSKYRDWIVLKPQICLQANDYHLDAIRNQENFVFQQVP